MIHSAISTFKEFSKLQVIRFLIVGVASFLVEFIVFAMLVDGAGVIYTYANLPAMTAAIIFNYFLTKKYVFETGKYNARTTFILFITFTLLGVILNQFLLWFFVEQIAVNIKVSKVLAVGLVAVFNFFTKKHFVF
jgi:putative flippase GtrA